MTRKQATCAVALWAAATCTLNPAAPVLGQDASAWVLVVNKSNAAVTMSKADVKRMLLGQTTSWPNGQKVMLVLAKSHTPDHVAVLQKLCGLNETDFMRYQMQLMFEGKPVTQIHEESSAATLKGYIKANPGAAGFVHPGDVDKDLKAVLTVE